MTMTKFDLDMARVDVLEHDKRGRGIVPVAVDKVRTELDRQAMNGAVTLNRKRLHIATADLLNTRIVELVNLLYESDQYGLINVQPQTGRMRLRGLPWGRNGRRLWDMSAVEADVMRAILKHRMGHRKVIPLFTLDVNEWFLNIHDYPEHERAIAYTETVPFEPGSIRKNWDYCVGMRNGSRRNG